MLPNLTFRQAAFYAALAAVFVAVGVPGSLLRIFMRLIGLPTPVAPYHPHNQNIGGSDPIYVYTKEELAEYRGLPGQKGIYVAVMGMVYDVEAGRKHYGPDGTYHGFAGRDVSLAFHTGIFEPDTEAGETEDTLTDVLTLSRSELYSLEQWATFYLKTYRHVGFLDGRFYDRYGQPTDYMERVVAELREHRGERERVARFAAEFPPCNMESTNNAGTRFWCTPQSGGIQREWRGRPWKFFEPSQPMWRCACVPEDGSRQSKYLERFDECEDDWSSCLVYPDEPTLQLEPVDLDDSVVDAVVREASFRPIKYDLSFNPEHFEPQPPPKVLEMLNEASRREAERKRFVVMHDPEEEWARFRRAIRREGPHLYEPSLEGPHRTMEELGRLGYL